MPYYQAAVYIMVTIEQAIENLLKSARRAPLSTLKQFLDVRHNGSGFEVKASDVVIQGVNSPGKIMLAQNWEAAERIAQGARCACGDNIRIWGYTMREAYLALYEELLRSDINDIQSRNAEILSAC